MTQGTSCCEQFRDVRMPHALCCAAWWHAPAHAPAHATAHAPTHAPRRASAHASAHPRASAHVCSHCKECMRFQCLNRAAMRWPSSHAVANNLWSRFLRTAPNLLSVTAARPCGAQAAEQQTRRSPPCTPRSRIARTPIPTSPHRAPSPPALVFAGDDITGMRKLLHMHHHDDDDTTDSHRHHHHDMWAEDGPDGPHGIPKECIARVAPAYIALAGLVLALFVYAAVFLARRRTAIRERYGIDGTRREDCLLYTFCAPCALAQETRTLMHEQVHDGIWYGALPGVAPASVPAAVPLPQKMVV